MRRLVLVVVLVLAIGGWGLTTYLNRKVASIKCLPENQTALSTAVGEFVGLKVSEFPNKIQQLLKDYPEIGNYTILERGWGNMILEVQPKQAAFSIERGGQFYYFDWNGRFIQQSQAKKGVVISLPYGKIVDEQGKLAQEVLWGAQTMFFLAKLEGNYQAQIGNSLLTVQTPSLQLIFPLQSDYKLLISKYFYIKNYMLENVRKNLVVNMQTPITIDLRYERPIAYKLDALDQNEQF